jgi:tetratricopeptide (TPR) repeat protein
MADAFDSALADCNEALQIRPRDASILDSRAFAYLKKGSLEDSFADYDAALSIDARKAASLYGRAIIKRRKKDIASSEADIAAAQAIRPNIVDYMARYGLD